MKIRNIEITKQNLHLNRPYTIAFKEVSYVENGIVKITTDKGYIGYGSFNPTFEVVGETLDDAISLFESSEIRFLIGRDIRELNQLCEDIQRQYIKSPSLRCGLEIALFDLFSQYLKLPLVRILGQKIKSMPTSITIGIKNVNDTLYEAKEYINKGFRILKIKLGKNISEDLEKIAIIRENFGNEIQLICDINQGYLESDLREFWNKSRHLNIDIIEQPMAPSHDASVRQLPDQIKQSLAADESVISVMDALRLSEGVPVYNYFNIKLMKCGGITQAKKILDIASYKDIGIIWGCNDESRISITAALHVAFSSDQTRYIDLDGSFDLAEDVVDGGFQIEHGIMSIPEHYGLGISPLIR